MSNIESIDELRKLRETIGKKLDVRTRTRTRIIVGMGTCGIAAGAQKVKEAIVRELQQRKMDVDIVTVGCIGMCSKEPLVDIEQAGNPRITYCNIQPDMVPRVIEEHLVAGNLVREWVLGRVSNQGIGQS